MTKRATSWGWLAALLIFAMGFVAIPAMGQGTDNQPLTWGVVPSTEDGPDGRAAFEYELDPGDSLVDHVAIFNYSQEDVEFAVYASDAFTTPAGGFDLLAADQPPTDVGTWVEFGVETVVVPARSRSDVPFRLSVPANATPGDHAGGVVASIVESADGAEGTEGAVRVDRRVGARIYLRVSGELDPGLLVTIESATYRASLVPFAPGVLDVEYTVENVGNVRVTGDTALTTAGPFEVLSRDTSLDPLPELLPGDSLSFTQEVDGVPPLFRLNTGITVSPTYPSDGGLETGAPVSAWTVLWAVPWTGLGAVVVVATFSVLLWRRRKTNAVPHDSTQGSDSGTASV